MKKTLPIHKSQAFQRAVQLHQQGELDQAEKVCKAILAEQPKHFDALHCLGTLRYQQGRNSEALDYFSAALKVKPTDVAALSNFGLVHALLGQLEEALASYDRALAFKPDYAAALSLLNKRGNVLRRLKRPEEALASYDRALALKPNYADALNNRGNALYELNRPAEALASYDKALVIRPDNAETLHNRGNVLSDLNRPAEALASYDRALALKPNYADALNNRGNALSDLNRPVEALASYDKALALQPDYVGALNNRGNALRRLNRQVEALASYDKALALKPDYIDAYDNKGVVLTELGRFNEASIAFEWAIKFAPKRTRSFFRLTSSKRLALGDTHLRAMEELARDMPLLNTEEQIHLHFALAKALADIGDQERSFRHLLDGNALKRKQTAYDEAATLWDLERMRAALTGQIMRREEGSGERSSVPVFVLGMPRSGSTLIEQILASHPKVFAAGEIDDFVKAVVELYGTAGGALPLPEALSRMSGEQLRQLGASYVGRIKGLAPTAERIVDKLPGNFLFTGLIHLALPNARIIHTRRDVIDTCLSCFSQLFAKNHPYSYDLAELGRYYQGYDALMAHWRGVLPENVMLEVQYEEVVADLEGQARRIVAHCGLEWDARCLDFHKTERSVRTASATQVRQPIYQSSVGRWRAYEAFLGPLLAELEPLIAGA
jgi:tetratricopeptide (TPR) repeat protein